MLKSYLKVAYRTLAQHKGYTAISMVSLVTGVMTCLLILLWVQHERSFDRHFAEADRIYRVTTEERSAARAEHTAMTTADLAPVLRQARPGLAVTRLYRWPYSNIFVQRGTHRFDERRFFRVDSTFFDVFSLVWISGDSRTALRAPYSVVLSERAAARYFGSEDPVGKTLRVGERTDYTVTGVARGLPPNSHVSFDFLAFNGRGFPDGWGEKKVWTYVKLPPQAEAAALAQRLPALVNRHFPAHLRRAITLSLQPLTDIHLDAHLEGEIQPGGNRTYLYVLGVVAVGFLLIACINYVNLATARAAQRAQEIGVRKAVGASKRQLIAQLLGESVLVSLVAVLISGALVAALRPVVNAALGLGIPPANWASVPLVGALATLVLLVGLLAGGYPAFYLAALNPLTVLKGALPRRGHEALLREGLVVFQFAATLILLVGTLVISQQVRYALSEERGVDRAGILMLTVPRAVAVGWDWDPSALRSELLRQPSVEEVSAVHAPWGAGLEQYRLRAPDGSGPPSVAAHVLWVADDHYADLYGLTLREGRANLRRSSADSAGATLEVVINEAAARQLSMAAPVGRDVEVALDEAGWQRGRVVGLVEDVHYRTLHHAIQPLLFVRGIGFSSVAVRLDTRDVAVAVADVAAVWERLVPDRPFEYVFLEDDYRQQYQAEMRVAGLARAFTALSLLIACLGLLGLTSFLVERRRKEVGIRKVLGASVVSIVALLSKDFVRLVLIALALAAPVAYLLMQQWLEGFAYRIRLSPSVFLFAGALALGVALLAVGYQAVKAATANPTDALRAE